MTGFGAQAYKAVSVDTGIGSGDPHQLVLMLYDGAIESLRQAFGHLKAGRVADKGQAISKAIRIIDEGLKVSLDRNAGGQLALRLLDLYDYMVMRLLQANVRNDERALAEVGRLLTELRDAWASIKPGAAATSAAPATVAAAPAAVMDAVPTRRLAVSA